MSRVKMQQSLFSEKFKTLSQKLHMYIVERVSHKHFLKLSVHDYQDDIEIDISYKLLSPLSLSLPLSPYPDVHYIQNIEITQCKTFRYFFLRDSRIFALTSSTFFNIHVESESEKGTVKDARNELIASFTGLWYK